MPPLLPYSTPCITGTFLRRHKRFSVEITMCGTSTWIHSNNSGSMLGLLQAGAPVLASPASNPARKLQFTQEAIWLAENPGWNAASVCEHDHGSLAGDKAVIDNYAAHSHASGFWVGVNTSVPNKLLEAAFHAGRLGFTQGYTRILREARRGQSRLDACCLGDGLPPLWIECKNVTMVEDDRACFPDAATERGQKHLRELMDIVACGERAAMFYLVQRPDGHCFGPADCIDPEYARLFMMALRAGVEMYPWRASISPQGVDLGEPIPLAPCLMKSQSM